MKWRGEMGGGCQRVWSERDAQAHYTIPSKYSQLELC